MSDAAPANLTGSWSGIFNYPHDMQPNGFNAILKDDGGVLVGETSEHSDDFDDSASVLHAWLEGRHDGDSVTFVKSYDAANRVDYSVSYRGSVSADGSEIRGIWNIPGIWSGTFIMVRKAGQTSAVEREVFEVVR